MARDLINQYRREKGLKPLKLNPAADGSRESALARSRQVGPHLALRLGRLEPVGPREAHRLQGQARGRERRHGPGHFDEVLRGWKESPGHNKNLLLGDAQEMGLALVQDPKTEFKSFWTLVIGASM